MTVHAPGPMPVPPWMAMVQAHTDQAEARTRALTETSTSLARDTTNGVVEDVIGSLPATHRKDTL